MNFLRSVPLVPEQASEHAPRYDLLFWTISGLTVVFTVIVAVMILMLASKYRRGSGADRSNPIDHHNGLETLWIAIPGLLALAMFVWATYNFVNYQRKPAEGALEVFVIGKRWMWHLQHTNGIRENNELHLPVGVPVKMTMISQDVIHAMYLPEFRAQFHVVPGRYTELFFTPTRTGRFKMLCAMHCGTKHSEMVGYVYVLPQAEFARWQENGGNRNLPVATSMAERGAQVWKAKNCGGCHGSGDNVRGPSLAGLIGKKRTFADGTSAVADRTYVRDSILNPWRQVVQGYGAEMPSYAGNLTETDLIALTAYIQGQTPAPGQAPASGLGGRPARRPLTSADDDPVDITNRFASPGVTQEKTGGSRR